jgi:hypothetical protein
MGEVAAAVVVVVPDQAEEADQAEGVAVEVIK